MRYRVIIEPPALADLNGCYLWIAERAPIAAGKWLDDFHQGLQSLATMPEKHGLAPENEAFDLVIRQITLGSNRMRRYRALYTIAEDRVHILHIRGPGQRLLRAGELRRPGLSDSS